MIEFRNGTPPEPTEKSTKKPMIEFRNVNLKFNKGTPLETTMFENFGSETTSHTDENLKIEAGELITIIGNNGAGKSTLLAIITGEIKIDSGSILLDGKDISKMPIHQRARYISKVAQDPSKGTFADLTIEENLLIAYNRGTKRSLLQYLKSAKLNAQAKEKAREYFNYIGIHLDARLNDKVSLLSGGQRQALSLVMATIQKPKVLLLDEHTSALDPNNANKIMELTRRIIKDNNLTALMITHNLDHVIDPNQTGCHHQRNSYQRNSSEIEIEVVPNITRLQQQEEDQNIPKIDIHCNTRINEWYEKNKLPHWFHPKSETLYDQTIKLTTWVMSQGNVKYIFKGSFVNTYPDNRIPEYQNITYATDDIIKIIPDLNKDPIKKAQFKEAVKLCCKQQKEKYGSDIKQIYDTLQTDYDELCNAYTELMKNIESTIETKEYQDFIKNIPNHSTKESWKEKVKEELDVIKNSIETSEYRCDFNEYYYIYHNMLNIVYGMYRDPGSKKLLILDYILPIILESAQCYKDDPAQHCQSEGKIYLPDSIKFILIELKIRDLNNSLRKNIPSIQAFIIDDNDSIFNLCHDSTDQEISNLLPEIRYSKIPVPVGRIKRMLLDSMN